MNDRPTLDHNFSLEPVSIVICARNEAENLKQNLPLVLNQDYGAGGTSKMYEVVVVDDESTDGTAEVLWEMQQKFHHLKVITIVSGTEHTFKGKKFALSKGVAASHYNQLLLTDADCLPAGKNWLRHMVAPLAEGKEIVAGYGAYKATRSLLNAFVRWENCHAFLQYFTYFKAGLPYMASGRNMACRKDLFLRAQQSPTWNLSASGDDDLVVSLFANNSNYTVVTNSESFTYTESPERFSAWCRQKQRHLTDGKSYKPRVKGLLGLYGFTHAATWFYFIPLLFSPYWSVALCIMAVRCIFFWGAFARAASVLREKSLLFLLPLFDFAWMLFNFAFLPYILHKNKQHWK